MNRWILIPVLFFVFISCKKQSKDIQPYYDQLKGKWQLYGTTTEYTSSCSGVTSTTFQKLIRSDFFEFFNSYRIKRTQNNRVIFNQKQKMSFAGTETEFLIFLPDQYFKYRNDSLWLMGESIYTGKYLCTSDSTEEWDWHYRAEHSLYIRVE